MAIDLVDRPLLPSRTRDNFLGFEVDGHNRLYQFAHLQTTRTTIFPKCPASCMQ
jgi:hypothetical protein